MSNEDNNMLGDLKIRSEDIAFRPDQLVTCSKCGKTNPPNRASCLYCGTALESAAAGGGAVKLNLRHLENWENGYNIVLIPPVGKADPDSIAKYFYYEPEQTERMLASADPFPLARLESSSEAEIAVSFLRENGVHSAVVSDVELKIGKPNVRLRSIAFSDDVVQLTSFNTGVAEELKNRDIALVVVGSLIETKTEALEKRKKGERQVLVETATASDDLLIDIYARDVDPGWRICTRGFDFSGLGAEKGLLAVENIQRILARLRELTPAIKFADDYRRNYSALSLIWDVEKNTDHEGLKRQLFGKSGFASVVRTSNLQQFSRYSRLQRILYEKTS